MRGRLCATLFGCRLFVSKGGEFKDVFVRMNGV
jgi:hypothetical protein